MVEVIFFFGGGEGGKVGAACSIKYWRASVRVFLITFASSPIAVVGFVKTRKREIVCVCPPLGTGALPIYYLTTSQQQQHWLENWYFVL